MAAFSFMDISKIKTAGQLTSKYIHNCRKIQIDNVIPELSDQNETLVALPKVSGKELNYNEALKDRLSTLDYYKTHDIRSNAVLGYEVLMTFSREAEIDLDAWKKQSTDWLHKTFDVAPDGRSNVLHAEYHADEVGNVHIHAFVVPIDERGHLNAKRFTDGSRAMSELQTSYADSVSDLGLKRGIAGSSAKHQDIRRMYANLNNAMVFPEVKPEETADEYRQRIEDFAKTAFARGMKEVDDYSNRKRQEADEQIKEERDAIERELKKKQKMSDRDLKKVEKRKDDLEKEVVSYENMVDMLMNQITEVRRELSQAQLELDEELNNENARAFYENMQLGLEVLEETSPEEAKTMRENIDYVQELAVQRREELEQQKELEEQEMNEEI